jgi:hypothetical protein
MAEKGQSFYVLSRNYNFSGGFGVGLLEGFHLDRRVTTSLVADSDCLDHARIFGELLACHRTQFLR